MRFMCVLFAIMAFPMLAYTQTWTSLQELPFVSVRAIFIADSSKFDGSGDLDNYADGAEMTSGWWDAAHKTSDPSMAEGFGLAPESYSLLTNEGHYYQGRGPNGHDVVSLIGDVEGFTGDGSWDNVMHKGSVTIAILFNTVASPSTETQFLFRNAFNSGEVGLRIQVPTGSNATRLALVGTSGSANAILFAKSSIISQGSWQLVAFRWDYGATNSDAFLWVDGLAPIDSAESAAVPSSDQATNDLVFGIGNTADQGSDSLQVAVWVVTDSVLTDADMTNLIEKISCDYDLGISGVSCQAPQATPTDKLLERRRVVF